MADGAFDDFAEPLGSAPSPEELCKFDLNDYGNAQRLIRLAGGQFGDRGKSDLRAATLLYLPEHGWIGFDGQRWDLKHGERLAQRLAHGCGCPGSAGQRCQPDRHGAGGRQGTHPTFGAGRA